MRKLYHLSLVTILTFFARGINASDEVGGSEQVDAECDKKVIVAKAGEKGGGVVYLEEENTHMIFFDPSAGKEKLIPLLKEVYDDQKANGCITKEIREVFEK